MATTGERLGIIETKVDDLKEDVDNLKVKMEGMSDEARAAHLHLSKEIEKFNRLLAWGRGGIFVFVGIGAALLWLWDQIKSRLGVR